MKERARSYVLPIPGTYLSAGWRARLTVHLTVSRQVKTFWRETDPTAARNISIHFENP
jgi:hypothetical protein